MSKLEYLVKTKSGSIYEVDVERHVLGKSDMMINIKGEKAKVIALTENPNAVMAVVNEKSEQTVNERNLMPGKVIIFSKDPKKVMPGNTSRIEKVYLKVA